MFLKVSFFTCFTITTVAWPSHVQPYTQTEEDRLAFFSIAKKHIAHSIRNDIYLLQQIYCINVIIKHYIL